MMRMPHPLFDGVLYGQDTFEAIGDAIRYGRSSRLAARSRHQKRAFTLGDRRKDPQRRSGKVVTYHLRVEVEIEVEVPPTPRSRWVLYSAHRNVGL